MSYTRPSAIEVAERRAALAPFDTVNEKTWLSLFATLLFWREHMPASYLDLGSGTGAMVNMARKIGMDAFGVDVINGPEHWFIEFDLNSPLIIHDDSTSDQTRWSVKMSDLGVDIPPAGNPKRFDLVTCLEVAEHLEADSGPTLADTIARHLAPGGILVFSAAPPGQAGEHHTNTRPASYWRTLMYERGISYREDYTRQLSHLWDLVAGPAAHWIAANVAVYDTWDGETV